MSIFEQNMQYITYLVSKASQLVGYFLISKAFFHLHKLSLGKKVQIPSFRKKIIKNEFQHENGEG